MPKHLHASFVMQITRISHGKCDCDAPGICHQATDTTYGVLCIHFGREQQFGTSVHMQSSAPVLVCA